MNGAGFFLKENGWHSFRFFCAQYLLYFEAQLRFSKGEVPGRLNFPEKSAER
jgi:hypothetical protein